ncbi:MAG TPA: hypothetical protein VLG50_05415 [Candidatus Saccharimonadales bacterium]|nr:hypothetical protein [Candidatus Saccharimonadales bacterium]
MEPFSLVDIRKDVLSSPLPIQIYCQYKYDLEYVNSYISTILWFTTDTNYHIYHNNNDNIEPIHDYKPNENIRCELIENHKRKNNKKNIKYRCGGSLRLLLDMGYYVYPVKMWDRIVYVCC